MPFGLRSPFLERISAECAHGSSRIVRGVVSEIGAGTSRVSATGRSRSQKRSRRARRTTCNECGVPSYLIDLDEPFAGYTLVKSMASLDSRDGAREVKAHIVAGTNGWGLPDILR